MKLALLLCIIAAIGYGFGAVLQAVGARRATCRGADGLVMMAKQPIFLMGLLCDFVSWVVSRIALHELPLFAVQTILAGSLAITVILAHFILHAELRTFDRWAVVATIVGLTIVGVSAGEQTAGHIHVALKIAILLGIPALLILAGLAVRMHKSIFLAVLAGAGFTGSALAARTVRIHHHSISSILGEPRLYAVVIYAGIALVLHALALQGSDVGPVTAAMWSTEVLVAAIVSATVLGDHLRDGWTIPAIVGIGMTLLATVVLSRSPAQDLEHRMPSAIHPVGHAPHPGLGADLGTAPQLANDPSDHH